MADTIRIGAFFDGTGANKYNDQLINDGSITNIGRLYDSYYKEYKKDGSNFAEPLYESGVGTREYNKDNTFTKEQIEIIKEEAKNGNYLKKIDYYNTAEMAFGIGAKDISNSMMEQVKKVTDKIKNENPNTQIIVDVSGFSRGAAIARDFINSFNEAYKNDPNVKVGFAVFLDTVSSVGTKHDVYNGDLNLNLNANSADTMLHLIADNEKRFNFPLHSLKDENGNLSDNMKEITVYGVHGNVGGGDPYFYKDDIVKDYGTKEFDKDNEIDKENVINSIKKTSDEKGFDAHINIEESLSTIQYVYTKKVDRTNGLSIANLDIVINEMAKNGIILDKDYSVPDDLKEYVNGVNENKDISQYKDAVKGYISISGGSITLQQEELKQNSFLMSLVNVNREEREIFSNKPDKAFTNDKHLTLEDLVSRELNISKDELNNIANSKEFQQELIQIQKEMEQDKISKENEHISKDTNTNSNVHMNLHR